MAECAVSPRVGAFLDHGNRSSGQVGCWVRSDWQRTVELAALISSPPAPWLLCVRSLSHSPSHASHRRASHCARALHYSRTRMQRCRTSGTGCALVALSEHLHDRHARGQRRLFGRIGPRCPGSPRTHGARHIARASEHKTGVAAVRKMARAGQTTTSRSSPVPASFAAVPSRSQTHPVCCACD